MKKGVYPYLVLEDFYRRKAHPLSHACVILRLFMETAKPVAMYSLLSEHIGLLDESWILWGDRRFGPGNLKSMGKDSPAPGRMALLLNCWVMASCNKCHMLRFELDGPA